jgi:hydroxymethylpyrimidine pyrophosphatase-like HAD family hydrolase
MKFNKYEIYDHDQSELDLRWGEKWLAVDMDGTLIHYDKFQGHDVFGDIIEPILAAVKERKLEGWHIAIYTARAHTIQNCDFIRDFLTSCGVPFDLITNVKKPYFKEFWDDRAVQVITNKGKFVSHDKKSAFDEQVGGNHYSKLVIHPAEYCEYNGIPAMESAVIKYVTRHHDKNGVEDLNKAINLINMIKEMRYTNDGLDNLINRINKFKKGE